MTTDLDAADDPKVDAAQQLLVDVDVVAAALGINRWTIYRWARAGRIPSLAVGRKVRFQLDAVIARLRRQPKVTPPARVPRRAALLRASPAAARAPAGSDHDARVRAAVAATRSLTK